MYQTAIDYAAVVYQAYGVPPFVIGGVFAFAILVLVFRRIGVAAYTFPALILMVIFVLIFMPKDIVEAVTTGAGSDEARQRLAELENMAPARYIAAPVLGLSALIFLRGHFVVPVLVLTVGMVYIIEAQFNPSTLNSLGLPTVQVADWGNIKLRNLQLGGGASGLKEGVSGLAGGIPLGK